uniref:DNA-directed RNA polymerase n=1 Tax=Pichia kluyveri TaxID=36015 RepID=O21375_PICKL|nr:RNA polymerase [Pichia kluyveri]
MKTMNTMMQYNYRPKGQYCLGNFNMFHNMLHNKFVTTNFFELHNVSPYTRIFNGLFLNPHNTRFYTTSHNTNNLVLQHYTAQLDSSNNVDMETKIEKLYTSHDKMINKDLRHLDGINNIFIKNKLTEMSNSIDSSAVNIYENSDMTLTDNILKLMLKYMTIDQFKGMMFNMYYLMTMSSRGSMKMQQGNSMMLKSMKYAVLKNNPPLVETDDEDTNYLKGMTLDENCNEYTMNEKSMSDSQHIMSDMFMMPNYTTRESVNKLGGPDSYMVYELSSDVTTELLSMKKNKKRLTGVKLDSQLPMVCKPKDYESKTMEMKTKNNEVVRNKVIYGGYLLNGDTVYHNMYYSKPSMKMLSKFNDVYMSTMNNLQSVSYKMNKDMLDWIIKNYEKYNLYTPWDTPMAYEHDIFGKEGKRTSKNVVKDCLAKMSKRDLENDMTDMAKSFKNVSKMYFPLRVDFRGRVYAQSVISYQSTDTAKALLDFGEVYKVNMDDVEYLFMSGANAYGLDKKSHMERINWIKTNSVLMYNLDEELMRTADNKLLFVKFCLEYRKYMDALNSQQKYYYSNYMVYVDATCNGFQHMALTLKDPLTCYNVNLANTSKDMSPRDFYTFIKDSVLDNMKDMNMNKNNSVERTLEMGLTRKMMKTMVMIMPYNAGVTTMTKYLEDSLNYMGTYYTADEKDLVCCKGSEENKDSCRYYKSLELNNARSPESKVPENNLANMTLTSKYSAKSLCKCKKIRTYYMDDENKIVSNKDLMFFINVMRKVVSDNFPVMAKFQNYLNNVSEMLSTSDKPVVWSLPTGIQVGQYYKTKHTKKISLSRYRRHTFNISLYDSKMDKSKSRMSLMPNTMHSLDATALIMLAEQMFKNNMNTQLCSIHDCFGAPISEIDTMKKTTSMTYTSIYFNNDYINKFNQDMTNTMYDVVDNYHMTEKNNKLMVTSLTSNSDIKMFPKPSLEWVKDAEFGINKNSVEYRTLMETWKDQNLKNSNYFSYMIN